MTSSSLCCTANSSNSLGQFLAGVHEETEGFLENVLFIIMIYYFLHSKRPHQHIISPDEKLDIEWSRDSKGISNLSGCNFHL